MSRHYDYDTPISPTSSTIGDDDDDGRLFGFLSDSDDDEYPKRCPLSTKLGVKLNNRLDYWNLVTKYCNEPNSLGNILKDIFYEEDCLLCLIGECMEHFQEPPCGAGWGGCDGDHYGGCVDGYEFEKVTYEFEEMISTIQDNATTIQRTWRNVTFKRQTTAAKRIQTAWRECVSNPAYLVCRKRLTSEFQALVM